MATLALLTESELGRPLPALDLLPHDLSTHPFASADAVSASAPDLLLIDATVELASAKRCCQRVRALAESVPVLVVVREQSLAAVSTDWGFTDFIVTDAGPAEVDARIRLLTAAHASASRHDAVRVGGLVIDEATYVATFRGRTLDLTYKEFELLHYFAENPGIVISRERLLDEVWGVDYYGGTRTVDVHVRRLRAKLGDHERIIGTVRNVGYRLLRPSDLEADEPHARSHSGTPREELAS